MSNGQSQTTPADIAKGTLLMIGLCALASASVVIESRNWLLGGLYFVASTALAGFAFILTSNTGSAELPWMIMWSVIGAAVLDLCIIMLLVLQAENTNSRPVGESPASVDWMSPTAVLFVGLVCGVGIGVFLNPRRRR